MHYKLDKNTVLYSDFTTALTVGVATPKEVKKILKQLNKVRAFSFAIPKNFVKYIKVDYKTTKISNPTIMHANSVLISSKEA